MFHGTQYIDTQIVNAVNVLQNVPQAFQNDCPLTEVKNFAKHVLGETYTGTDRLMYSLHVGVWVNLLSLKIMCNADFVISQ